LRGVTADDDETQVAVFGIGRYLGAQHGEGFNQARDVFLGADAAGIKYVRVSHAVAFKDTLGERALAVG